jgi:16S rRNA (cytidine1402-2'-O)-methyltransferase
MPEVEPGTLYLVATPIGNLDDITLRSLKILQAVDWIAAEDTRHSGQLLKHFGIDTRSIGYHAHNIAQRTPIVVEKLKAGAAIAAISDAGTPGISDPGVELVQACIAAGIPVVPVPGPTAAIAAVVASGLPTNRFVFEGFLPTARQARSAILQALIAEPRTILLYEAPHRLVRTLGDLVEVLGPERSITLAREITKRYEEFWRGSLAAALEHYSQHSPRGEFTLAIAGAPATAKPLTEEELRHSLQDMMAQGLSRSQASREVAKLVGGDRRALYQLALTLPPVEAGEVP